MGQPVIERLYYVFSRYELNEKVTGCYCYVCMDESSNNFLQAKPIKEIDAEEFNQYLGSVDIATGNCNDFKYFLPRILEHLIYDNNLSIHTWNVLFRVDFENWPNDEKSAVVEFFKELWLKIKEKDDSDLDDPTIHDIKNKVIKPFCV